MKGKNIKVLIIDDDINDFELMQEAFSSMNFNTYSIAWCKDPKEAMELFQKDEYDLYLVDYKLGPDNGFSLIQDAHKIGINRPFIVVTGQGNYNTDVKAMEIGAENYISKDDIGTEIFERTIRYTIKKFYDRNINLNDYSNNPIFKKAMRFSLTSLL